MSGAICQEGYHRPLMQKALTAFSWNDTLGEQAVPTPLLLIVETRYRAVDGSSGTLLVFPCVSDGNRELKLLLDKSDPLGGPWEIT